MQIQTTHDSTLAALQRAHTRGKFIVGLATARLAFNLGNTLQQDFVKQQQQIISLLRVNPSLVLTK